MKSDYITRILFILSFSLIILQISYSREIENSYDYWKNYRFVKEIPANSVRQFVVVSSRYLDTVNFFVVKRGVHPNRKMFYFVASLVGDSCYLKPCNTLTEAINVFPDNRDFLLFVNGHGKNFDRNLGRGLLLDERYHVNVILFEWPTDNRTLTGTARNARKLTTNFSAFIKEFSEVKNKNYSSCHASIIFHSMGNQIARNLANSEGNTNFNIKIFDNLILNAAAVMQWRHAHWVEKLHIQDRIFIISNQGDYPLHGVWLLRKSKPLGMYPKLPIAKNATYIDFSLVAGEAHNYYTGRTELEKQNPHVNEFYQSLFHGRTINTSDSLVFKLKENRTGFYIY